MKTANKATPRNKVKILKIAKKRTKETALLNPWSRILDQIRIREIRETEIRIMWLKLKPRTFSSLWMRPIKKDSTFRKVMETKKDLKDPERFDWLESAELAINKRKFQFNR